jgi:thiamine-monophosphate kinase
MTSERELTASFASFFPRHRDVQVGIGDDAAVVQHRHANVVLCCDPVIEGVHFAPDTQPHLIGRKAVNRNLSDIAAMGGVADWLLVSLVLPRTMATVKLQALLVGLRAAAKAAKCFVVGGDVATSTGPLVITVSAFGHHEGRALTRGGARPGDQLHVTGSLGGSLLGHHLRFRPALAEGAWLAKQACVNAAMDISDGLLLDLQTMLTASGGFGAELDAHRIPIRAAAKKLAKGCPSTALRHALEDGEDHVLLWSQSPDGKLSRQGPLTKRARQSIGRVVSQPGLWLVQDGQRRELSPQGFQHLLDNATKRSR